MGKYDAMTVNERLFDADLLNAFHAVNRSGDLEIINDVLRKVDLRQDESGMNWPINAPNR